MNSYALVQFSDVQLQFGESIGIQYIVVKSIVVQCSVLQYSVV